jgi:hypothetical protein
MPIDGLLVIYSPKLDGDPLAVAKAWWMPGVA